MSNLLYLLINFLIIIFPFILSFTKKYYFLNRASSVFLSTLTVSIPFIFWDIIVTNRGHWAFNPKFTLTYRLLGLPIEEILFFVTVPYSCIFLYHYCKKHFGAGNRDIGKYSKNILALVFVFLGFLSEKEYTILVMVSTGILLISLSNKYITSLSYLVYIFLGFILFTIFNYLLTSIPIVTYSKQYTSGIRLATIPIEDYFYNFVLLTLYAKAYDFFSRQS